MGEFGFILKYFEININSYKKNGYQLVTVHHCQKNDRPGPWSYEGQNSYYKTMAQQSGGLIDGKKR